MEDQKKNEVHLLQRLSLMAPLIGAFLIFLGSLRLIVFYNFFDIHIVNYLEFTEIITSFLDVLAISVFFIVTSLIQGLWMNDQHRDEKQDSIRNQIYHEKSFFRRIFLYFKQNAELIILGAFISLIAFVIYLIYGKALSTIQNIGLLLFVFIFLTGLFYELEIRIQDYKSGVRVVFRTMLIGTIISLLTAYLANYQVDMIKNDNEHSGYTITLNNGEILKSDSTSYYIGKTRNYLFFYDGEAHSTNIIPMDRVQQISIEKESSEKGFFIKIWEEI